MNTCGEMYLVTHIYRSIYSPRERSSAHGSAPVGALPLHEPVRALLNWLAVWLSGNTLASINVVALRQTRLVLGWVTVCGRVNHLGM